MSPRIRNWFALAGMLALLIPSTVARAQEDLAQAVRQRSEQLVSAFNAGKVDDIAGFFLPAGELIDEAGVVYQGTDEIKSLLTAFFENFAGAKLAIQIDSVRVAGPVAIEEGARTMTTADGKLRSRFRYIAIWAKTDKDWKLASFRDFADASTPAPRDNLEPLAWLVGDWVNEGTDGDVSISYRWSEDGNYLLGEFNVRPVEGEPRKSTQRIAWDPATESIRSWIFDADGGFSESVWSLVEDGIVAKSQSTNPDGATASATLTIMRLDNDHYTIAGTDRIVAGTREPDFEITVTRRPPQAGK